MLARTCQGEGTEYLDDLFWRLTEATRHGARLEDDISAALLEFAPDQRR